MLIIGLMSGSSLDGVDIVAVEFHESNRWNFNIVAAESIPYPESWKLRLSDAYNHSVDELQDLDRQYGKYLGEMTRSFIERHHLQPDLVASHGHTVFHRPQEGFTLQLGDGQALADECRIKTINDFRTEDVKNEGQGAPLVPIGDLYLFSEYPICLNIGGIANVSYDVDNKRIAYDICIANQVLNYLAGKKGLDYDKDGDLARSGKISSELFDYLNSNTFFTQKAPKSLGREYFEKEIHQLVDNSSLDVNDLLSTFTEHIAYQINKSIQDIKASKMLITGGGARNKYLVERIQHYSRLSVFIPSEEIIDFKEAIIFAFLGLLKNMNRINILSSVTGAKSDSSAGKIWLPK